MNSYLIFNQEMRHKLLLENANLTVSEISQAIGQKWAKMTPEMKSEYTKKAAVIKKSFMEENPNYVYSRRSKAEIAASGAHRRRVGSSSGVSGGGGTSTSAASDSAAGSSGSAAPATSTPATATTTSSAPVATPATTSISTHAGTGKAGAGRHGGAGAHNNSNSNSNNSISVPAISQPPVMAPMNAQANNNNSNNNNNNNHNIRSGGMGATPSNGLHDADNSHQTGDVAINGKAKGRGSKKKVKDPDAPKHPIGSFLYFRSSESAKIRQQYPNEAIPKVAAKMWAEMSEVDKKPWEKKAAQDKQRYAEEMELHTARKSKQEKNRS